MAFNCSYGNRNSWYCITFIQAGNKIVLIPNTELQKMNQTEQTIPN